MMLDHFQEQKEVKLHTWNIIPKKHVVCDVLKRPAKAIKEVKKPTITWTVSDIAKAGCLLASPPLNTNFTDEQEMRRVYTLIYDVFRYKNILNEALNDISFFQLYPKLAENIPHIWLLFYDLYHRAFKKRESAHANLHIKLLTEAGLIFAENALFSQRVKLAAAVSRLRIRRNALSLSDLLPDHLKDEKLVENATNTPVTCWVNTKKTGGFNELCNRIERMFKLTMVEDINLLGPTTYKWDKHCPQIMAFHSSMRTALARSQLIKSHELVVQDKSFCLGPATFCKIVSDLQLSGSVIQTHINSPRSTAYLAQILSKNEKIKKLMAFSAGKRKTEYENYFIDLGMTNVVIFADRLIDMSPDASYMEEVVAVFATPPNSYSAVNDPIDLICSRGGDLSMLEALTESEETEEGRKRVGSILEEQRKTLRFAMSRPQIQVVLYETHSELDAENKAMVDRTIKEVNKVAKIQHAALQGKIIIQTTSQDNTSVTIANKEINNNEKVMLDALDVVDEKGEESRDEDEDEDDEYVEEDNEEEVAETEVANVQVVDSITKVLDSHDSILEEIKVPDTDLFDRLDLPSLCPNEDPCVNLSKEGCYLALLQRKQVIRLDNKYMIKMAEHRGLFGSNATTTARTKGSKGSKKKQNKTEAPTRKSKKRLKDEEDIPIETAEKENPTTPEPGSKPQSPLVVETPTPPSEMKKGDPAPVRAINTSHILGHLSSYQVRQLVSASYKGQHIYSKKYRDEGEDEERAVSRGSTSSRVSKERRPPRKIRRVDSAVVEKQAKEVLQRLTTPTQAFLTKCIHMRKNVEVTQLSLLDGSK